MSQAREGNGANQEPKPRHYLIAAYMGLLIVPVPFGLPFRYLARKVDDVDAVTDNTEDDYRGLGEKYNSKRSSGVIKSGAELASLMYGMVYVVFRFYLFDFWRLHYWAVKSVN